MIADPQARDEQGAVFVFTESEGVWTERQELAVQVGKSDRAVSIDGGVLAAGSHMYRFDNNSWVLRGTLAGNVGAESALDGNLLISGIIGSDTSEESVSIYDLGTLNE